MARLPVYVLAASAWLAGSAHGLRVPPALGGALDALASVLHSSGQPATSAPPVSAVDLPATFDTRLQWFGCGLTVLDQGA
jgi:hypothetical protein